MKTKRLFRAGVGGLCLCLLLSLCGFAGECAEVRERVVRLHILAHSDSAEDQALKLRVRDAVVEAAAGWLDGAQNTAEAMALAKERLPQLEAVAQATVAAAGYDYPVKAELTEMYFTTRQYDTVTLPAGVYEAVRFTIGSGEGKNWWCVVYPPLCAGAAIKRQTLRDVLNDRQVQVISGGERFKVRFKVVEWAQQITGFFRR